jgi:hypothetical protein
MCVIFFCRPCIFTHGDSQECGEWCPVSGRGWGEVGGGGADGEAEEVYLVHKLQFSVQGAASTRDNMGIVYTCQLLHCVIHCPCGICTDNRHNCKRLCKTEVCTECNSQCTQHELKVPRLFDPKTDNYTMVTDKMDRYRFAHPYAGIPVTCKSCCKGVLEHQIYHLVFHLRCRFCRHEARPFMSKAVVSIDDYKKADRIVKFADERTCRICLFKCKDNFTRKVHESTVHEKKGKYKCVECDKRYSNSNALIYHKAKHNADNAEVEKYLCYVCGKQCSTGRSLLRHIKLLHNKQAGMSCANPQAEAVSLNFSLGFVARWNLNYF